MSRKPIVAQSKAVTLSEWVKFPGRTVTRAECFNVVRIMIERRLEVERAISKEALWSHRFWRWLTTAFNPLRGPTEAEIADFRAQAMNPAAGADTPAAEIDEGEIDEEGPPEPEGAFEETESGGKFRDRRKGRQEAT